VSVTVDANNSEIPLADTRLGGQGRDRPRRRLCCRRHHWTGGAWL